MKYILMAALAGTILCGCSKTEDQPGDTDKGPSVKKDASSANNPTTVNDPTNVEAGQSIRVPPANPNDPKFRQDPKLSGGG